MSKPELVQGLALKRSDFGRYTFSDLMSNSSEDSAPPLDIQMLVIGDYLNSTLLFTYLMGMYTIVFAFTIYTYTITKRNKSTIVAAVLWLLFAVNIANFGIQWSSMNDCLINNGQTMLAELICNSNGNFGGLSFACSLLVTMQYILADGLLVWRCYHITGKSLSSIVIPLFLLICEAALSIAVLVITAIFCFRHEASTERLHVITDVINAVFNTTAALTTVSSTLLIWWRITTSMTETERTRRYHRIIRIAIESSVLYSLASIVAAVTSILDSLPNLNVSVAFGFDYYVNATTSVLTAIAPTLMVAQISLDPGTGSTEVSNTLRFSSLHFDQQATADSTSSSSVPSDVPVVPGNLSDIEKIGVGI